MPLPLHICYEDEHYIAIDKPSGVLVHKTPLERDPDALFAVQLLRNQIGKKVYPLHRLDRPTSGVLLFAKSSVAASLLQPDFALHSIQKHYLAVVRGYLQEKQGVIDHPMAKDLQKELQEAKTTYHSLAETEIPFASSTRYPTSRYSLVQVSPLSGRMHQIRRHFAHIRHYIIGDKTHGDNKQNNFFRRHYQSDQLLLHAWKLAFTHPYSLGLVEISAPLPCYFTSVLTHLGWDDPSLQSFSPATPGHGG